MEKESEIIEEDILWFRDKLVEWPDDVIDDNFVDNMFKDNTNLRVMSDGMHSSKARQEKSAQHNPSDVKALNVVYRCSGIGNGGRNAHDAPSL